MNVLLHKRTEKFLGTGCCHHSACTHFTRYISFEIRKKKAEREVNIIGDIFLAASFVTCVKCEYENYRYSEYSRQKKITFIYPES